MNAHVEELAKEIRSLPDEARTYLMDQLMESMEVAEVERAWEVELDRRDAEVESGRVRPLSEAELKARVRAALSE